MRSFFLGVVAAPFLLGLAFASNLVTGCNELDGDSGDDDDAGCNGASCGAGQYCLYYECSASANCVDPVEGTDGLSACPSGSQSSGSCASGCESTTACTGTAQGCRDIPSSCGNDLGCACQNVCTGKQSCVGTDGGTNSVTCTAPN